MPVKGMLLLGFAFIRNAHFLNYLRISSGASWEVVEIKTSLVDKIHSSKTLFWYISMHM